MTDRMSDLDANVTHTGEKRLLFLNITQQHNPVSVVCACWSDLFFSYSGVICTLSQNVFMKGYFYEDKSAVHGANSSEEISEEPKLGRVQT